MSGLAALETARVGGQRRHVLCWLVGLWGWTAARGGSLLLAQLALMPASALAVACCWAWRQPGSGLQPGLRMGFGLAWLSLGWLWVLAAAPASAAPASLSWLVLESPRAARVALLALAPAALWLVSLWRSRQAGRARWWIMLLAAAPVVLAVSWPETAGTPPGNDTPADPYDPYTTSTWR